MNIQGTVTGRYHHGGQQLNRRIEDSEVLFTSLVLMFGEYPPAPQPNSGNFALDDRLRWIEQKRQYAFEIKLMMAELGHEPNQGLYTEYIHWVHNAWEKKYDESQSAEATHESQRATLRNVLDGSRPTPEAAYGPSPLEDGHYNVVDGLDKIGATTEEPEAGP